MLKRTCAGLVVAALLAGCANDQGVDSPPEAVRAAAFRADGPRTLTVFTMINNRTGKGGHSALMVNGSQQVIFDPAGSFRDPRVVERGDVLYEITPAWINAYKSAHARSTYHVVEQQFVVTDAQAEQALNLVMQRGAVSAAFCANATTDILSQIPGFEFVDRTFYPEKLMTQLQTRPNVETSRHYEDDAGDVVDAVRAAQSS